MIRETAHFHAAIVVDLCAEARAPPRLSDAPLATDKAAKDSAERRQVTVMFSDLVGMRGVVSSGHLYPDKRV